MTLRRVGASPQLLIALIGTSLWCQTAAVQVSATTLAPITAVAFTPNGREVVVGSQAGLEVQSWPELARVATLPTELGNIHDLAFSPDGKILAVAGGRPGIEGTVELFRWPERELLRHTSPHDDVIYAVSWRSDGKELALASGDRRVGLLNVAAELPARYLEGHSRAVLATTFLQNDDGPLSGGVDASIRLWDPPNRTIRRVLSNHTSAINDLKIQPIIDSQALPMVASAGDDRTVRFWQPTIGRLVRFARLDSAALALAWSADGRIIWAACKDGRLRGIDPTDASVKGVLSAIDGVAYSLAVAPDRRVLVAGSNGQLRIMGDLLKENR